MDDKNEEMDAKEFMIRNLQMIETRILIKIYKRG